MAINYSSPGVPGGEVSPGAGSTGFTSNRVPYVNTSGQLTADSSGLWWDSTQKFLGIGTGTTAPTMPIDLGESSGFKIRWATSVSLRASSAKDFRVNVDGSDRFSVSTASVSVGSATNPVRFSLPSTLNMSSAVGVAGGAAALPATPESYIKILAPNNAGTLTTLYIPAYLSTA